MDTLRRREEAARELGVQPDEVALIVLDLDWLLKAGALIDIDIGGVTIFSRRSSWEELGVPEQSLRRRRFTKGVKHLIPPEYIKRLRSLAERARQLLDHYSFVVEGFRPYRWVPYTAYHKWRREFEKLRQEFEALKAEILAKYDEFVESLRRDFEAIAQEVYPTLGPEMSLEEFTASLIEKALSKMPPKEALGQALYMEYKTAILVDPASWERHLAEVKKARLEAEIELERLRAEREKIELARILEQEKALQELRKLEEMRRAELEHYKEQLRRMASPVEEVLHQLRARMCEHARAVLELLRTHGTLTGPGVRRVKNMVETFRLLNALGDKELERLINEVAREMEKRTQDSENLADLLNQIVDLTAESAQKALKPSRASAVRLGL
mgnify:CR=1 FL=1